MRVALHLASLLTLLACSTGTGLARCADTAHRGIVCARLGEEFDAHLGDTVYIADTRLSIRVNGVPEDSRCPRDAVCVWAGNARVSLTLRHAANTDDVSVNTTLDPEAVVRWGYTVQLVDVRPLPTAGQRIAPSEYVVRLAVTRANN